MDHTNFIKKFINENKDIEVQKIYSSYTNINDDKILISGGFKTGTCTLQRSLNCFRTHDIYLERPNDNISTVIFPFRENEYVYKSALFQDITEPVYEYSPFAKNNFLHKLVNLSIEEKEEIIKSIDVNKLIEHYKKINWDQYLHLNNKVRLDIINSYYGINIDYGSKNIQIFILTRGTKIIKIISFNITLINNNNIFDELKNIIYGEKKDDIILQNDNIGDSKWYNTKYNEFLKEINIYEQELFLNFEKHNKNLFQDICNNIGNNKKMLVFGLGDESKMWYEKNGKNTYFIEDKDEIINKFDGEIPIENIIKYEYKTCCKTSGLLKSKQIKEFKVPEELLRLTPFDVILIDGPENYHSDRYIKKYAKKPGRLIPCYWSSLLNKSGSIIYVNHSELVLEDYFIKRFFNDNVKEEFIGLHKCTKIYC